MFKRSSMKKFVRKVSGSKGKGTQGDAPSKQHAAAIQVTEQAVALLQNSGSEAMAVQQLEKALELLSTLPKNSHWR